MKTFLAIIVYLILVPILAGLLEGVGTSLSLRLQKEKSISFLQSLRHLFLLYGDSWREQPIQRLFAISYLIFLAAGGAIIFAGGSTAISVILISFAESAALCGFIFFAQRNHKDELKRAINCAIMRISQLMIASAGFYCSVGLYHETGSFLTRQIVGMNIAPALYMPSVLIGLIWIILYSSEPEILTLAQGYFQAAATGPAKKEDAIYKTGQYYQKAILYSILFLFNFSGTIVSGVVSAFICAVVWFFSLLLRHPHSKVPTPEAHSIISAILLVSSFINLLILLKSY